MRTSACLPGVLRVTESILFGWDYFVGASLKKFTVYMYAYTYSFCFFVCIRIYIYVCIYLYTYSLYIFYMYVNHLKITYPRRVKKSGLSLCPKFSSLIAATVFLASRIPPPPPPPPLSAENDECAPYACKHAFSNRMHGNEMHLLACVHMVCCTCSWDVCLLDACTSSCGMTQKSSIYCYKTWA